MRFVVLLTLCWLSCFYGSVGCANAHLSGSHDIQQAGGNEALRDEYEDELGQYLFNLENAADSFDDYGMDYPNILDDSKILEGIRDNVKEAAKRRTAYLKKKVRRFIESDRKTSDEDTRRWRGKSRDDDIVTFPSDIVTVPRPIPTLKYRHPGGKPGRRWKSPGGDKGGGGEARDDIATPPSDIATPPNDIVTAPHDIVTAPPDIDTEEKYDEDSPDDDDASDDDGESGDDDYERNGDSSGSEQQDRNYIDDDDDDDTDGDTGKKGVWLSIILIFGGLGLTICCCICIHKCKCCRDDNEQWSKKTGKQDETRRW